MRGAMIRLERSCPSANQASDGHLHENNHCAQGHAFGADDNDGRTKDVEPPAQALFLAWVTSTERKWVILDERRGDKTTRREFMRHATRVASMVGAALASGGRGFSVHLHERSNHQQGEKARVPHGRGVSLFNGENLTGWKTPSSHWVVEDGALLLKGRHDGKGRPNAYIWTEETFGDFILDVDFKIPEGRANSGIFIRLEDPKKPVQTGIEISIANPRPDGGLDKNSVGSIYNLVAPKKNAFKPSEWNYYRITCESSRITVELNGEVVTEADLDLWTEPYMNPDGTSNKFTKPLKDFARRGHIGLQDHGSPVAFQNIRIKRLDE